MHRDIKPSNILLTNNGDVKIADFGVWTQLNHTFDNRNSYVGTINWMAPEILEDEPEYGLEVDIWSVGIIAIELATGKVPYSDMTQFEALKSIKENEPPRLTGHFSIDFKDFIDQWLMKNPEERSSVFKLLKHNFVNHNKMTSNLCTLIDNIESDSMISNHNLYGSSNWKQDSSTSANNQWFEESKDKICLDIKKHQQYRNIKANHLKRKLNNRDTVLPNDPKLMNQPMYTEKTKPTLTQSTNKNKTGSDTTMAHSSEIGHEENFYNSYSEEENPIKISTPTFSSLLTFNEFWSSDLWINNSSQNNDLLYHQNNSSVNKQRSI